MNIILYICGEFIIYCQLLRFDDFLPGLIKCSLFRQINLYATLSLYFSPDSRSLLLNQIPALPSNSVPTRKIERWPHSDPEGQECPKRRREHGWWVPRAFRTAVTVPTRFRGGLTSISEHFHEAWDTRGKERGLLRDCDVRIHFSRSC